MQNKKICNGLMFLAFSFMTGCGGGSSAYSNSYIFCLNCPIPNTQQCQTDNSKCRPGGCTTGAHAATSKEDVCTVLNSKAPNNNCETDERKKRFTELGCPGTFTNN